MTFESGVVRQADLIIGADGIRVRLSFSPPASFSVVEIKPTQSTMRSFVLGEDIHIPPSHTAGFRWLTNASALEPYSELDWIVKTPPLGARLISAPVPSKPSEGPRKIDHRTIVIYACRGGTMVNVLAVHEDLRDQDSVRKCRKLI